MTKKDFIKFAILLKQSRRAIKEGMLEGRKITAEGLQKAIERDIADLLAETNERFDYDKFMNYITQEE